MIAGNFPKIDKAGLKEEFKTLKKKIKNQNCILKNKRDCPEKIENIQGLAGDFTQIQSEEHVGYIRVGLWSVQ